MLHDPTQNGLACEVTAEGCVIRAWFPGLTSNRLRVAVRGDLITIWTLPSPESIATPANGELHTPICHSMRLPAPVNTARIAMHYANDELVVTLPNTRGQARWTTSTYSSSAGAARRRPLPLVPAHALPA
ncbi:MAG: Hsp20/alpha crystallin family protein [Chloroflexota bacterium]